MAINFDTLPNSAPNQLPPKGTYYATIEKAEMKQGKDLNKPPYLNMMLNLQTSEGKNAGKIFDMLFDSDHEVVRYKLRRFIEAMNIPITGAFELTDICKIIVGKKLIVDITHDEKGQIPKAVVDVFAGKVFYPMSEASELFGGSANLIQATDALDASKEPDLGADNPFSADY